MDRLLAIIGLLVLTAFLGILVYSVPRLDLMAVAGITIALAAYDFFRSLRKNGGASTDS